ncbi:HPr kinase (plasmid) [Tistrella mobilis]|uniref:HPr kinase n=1 Tax=Tistrella mobilis TaxID=171437 RepID=UPI003556C96A
MMPGNDLPYRYRMLGLVLASAVPLGGLEPAGPEAGDPVATIRLGPVPEDLPAPLFTGPHSRIDATHYIQILPGLGRLMIVAGREVVLAPDAPEHVDHMMRVAVYTHLSFCNGLLPLHASGLVLGDGVAAFCGDSGAGKSTLAAAFTDAGTELVADDVCHLQEVAGETRVRSLQRELRLWDSSVAGLAWAGRGESPVAAGVDKFRFDDLVPAAAADRLLPLRGIFGLAATAETPDIRIERLSGLAALKLVLGNLYGGWVMGPLGREPAIQAAVLRLVQRVPVHRLHYPRRFDALPGVVVAVRQHLAAAVPAVSKDVPPS